MMSSQHVFRAAGAFLIATAAATAAGAAAPQAAPPRHAEAPDDPPGIRREPAGPRSRTVLPARGTLFAPVQVNVDALGFNIPNDAANEPSIAVDPSAPNRLVIGWRQFDTVDSNFRQAGLAYSHDGGRTWVENGPLEPGIFRSDPVLGADEAGRFYYYSLRSSFLTDFFFSDDGGVTWSLPVPAFGGDKQWFAIDGNTVYASWSINAACCGDNDFIRSFDSAASFESPVEIPNTPIFGTLAVDSAGAVYVTGVNRFQYDQFWVAKSSSAQDPFSPTVFETVTEVGMGGSMRLGATPNPDGLLGQAQVAVDRSGGPHDGNVYLLCSTTNSLAGDPLDVRLARSLDGGQSFLPPVRVNDDPPATFRWQWFGTLSVAPNGRIDAVWNDTRDDPTVTFSTLYYAFSIDGGVTFSPNEPISIPFNHFLGYPQQNKLGDYYHMISDDVGAHLAFAATFNGEQDVYYLRLGDYDCNGNGVADTADVDTGASGDCNDNGIPDECEIAAGTVEDDNGNGIPDACDNPGDIDGDGVAGFNDLLIVLSGWGPCPTPPAPCPGDIDGDGNVGQSDLLIVLSFWG